MISVVFETVPISDELAVGVFKHFSDIVSLPIIRNAYHSVPLSESAVAKAGYDANAVSRMNALLKEGGDYVLFHDGTNQLAVTNNENLGRLQSFQTPSGNFHPMNLLQETLVESYDLSTGKIGCKVYVEDLSDVAKSYSNAKVKIASFLKLKDYNKSLKDVVFEIRQVTPRILGVSLDGISIFVLGVGS